MDFVSYLRASLGLGSASGRVFGLRDLRCSGQETLASLHPSSGPDGPSVRFFQKFWKDVKWVVMAIFQDFFLGVIDASRLNYGVVTLIPKVVGVTDIRQFRPITVLNVISLSWPRCMPLGRHQWWRG